MTDIQTENQQVLSEAQMSILNVALGNRSYDILIGRNLLERAGREITKRRPDARTFIITDENLANHHLPSLISALKAENVYHGEIILPFGETTKSYQHLSEVTDFLLKNKIERGDLVIALGGGVIGDLAGFAASVVLRGIDFVQIPTSLLAQVDSSVGGKTGINASYGKNLIGAFHQPVLVLADTDVLSTLEPRQFRAGYAEVVKYGLIRDRRFFDWLSSNWQAVFDLEPKALHKIIRTSCEHKAEIVSEDEREGGIRALLNLGHTFGHAFEAYTGYSDKLLHGEAIAIGMALAFELSQQLGFTNDDEAEKVIAHFRRVGLPTSLSGLPGADNLTSEHLYDLMSQDKKIKRGIMVLILAHQIGDGFICADVTKTQLMSFLHQKLNEL